MCMKARGISRHAFLFASFNHRSTEARANTLRGKRQDYFILPELYNDGALKARTLELGLE
jgi:hypothetical protein